VYARVNFPNILILYMLMDIAMIGKCSILFSSL